MSPLTWTSLSTSRWLWPCCLCSVSSHTWWTPSDPCCRQDAGNRTASRLKTWLLYKVWRFYSINLPENWRFSLGKLSSKRSRRLEFQERIIPRNVSRSCCLFRLRLWSDALWWFCIEFIFTFSSEIHFTLRNEFVSWPHLNSNFNTVCWLAILSNLTFRSAVCRLKERYSRRSWNYLLRKTNESPQINHDMTNDLNGSAVEFSDRTVY